MRPAREALDARSIGLTHYRWKPGMRVGFGHVPQTDEEIYVVVRGGGRMKLDDDVVELRTKDALRFAPATIREWEVGPDGLELLAFGTHTEGNGELRGTGASLAEPFPVRQCQLYPVGVLTEPAHLAMYTSALRCTWLSMNERAVIGGITIGSPRIASERNEPPASISGAGEAGRRGRASPRVRCRGG